MLLSCLDLDADAMKTINNDAHTSSREAISRVAVFLVCIQILYGILDEHYDNELFTNVDREKEVDINAGDECF